MTAITNSEILDVKRRWGTYLIRMAWVIEANAALLGLIIAWSMGFQTYETLIENDREFGIFMNKYSKHINFGPKRINTSLNMEGRCYVCYVCMLCMYFCYVIIVDKNNSG